MASINAPLPVATALLPRSHSGQRHDQAPKPVLRTDDPPEETRPPEVSGRSEISRVADAERLFALRAADSMAAMASGGAVAAYRFNHPAISTTPLDPAPIGLVPSGQARDGSDD